MERIEKKINTAFQYISQNPFGFFVFILVINLIFRFYNVAFGSFDLDEATHTHYGIMSFPDLVRMAGNDPNPPLYNLLIGYWIKVFGLSETGIRSFSVILNSVTASVLFLFARKFVSIQVAVFAALLFTFSSVQFFYAHNARVYALVGLLIVASFYFYFQLLFSSRKTENGMAYLLVNVLLLYTHIAPIYVLAVQALSALVICRNRMKTFIYVISLQFLSVILLIPWIVWSPYYNKSRPTSWEQPPGFLNVTDLFSDYLNTDWLFYIFLVFLITFLILVYFKKIVQRTLEEKFVVVLLASWAFLPVLLNFLVSHAVVPIFIRRYMVYASIGLYLFFIFMIWKMPFRPVLKTGISLLIVLFFAATINTRTLIGEQWREAVTYVKENKSRSTLVVVSPYFQFTSFAFYFDKNLYKDYKNTISLLKEENVYFEDKPVLFDKINIRDYKKIIFLNSQREVVDSKRLLSYMKDHFTILETTDFFGVSAYLFKVPGSESVIREFLVDYDENHQKLATDVMDSSLAHSGKRFSKTSPAVPFSSGHEIVLNNLPELSASAEISAWCFAPGKIVPKGLLVASLENNGVSYQYQSVALQDSVKPGRWQEIKLLVKIPTLKSKSDVLKVYVWNTGTSELFTDDIRVVFKN